MVDDPLTKGTEDQVTRGSEGATDGRDAVGPYRLLQLVGTGGMGDVWLAEQTRPVRRQVALKIIKAGMDTTQVVARFEAERQALALMDHAGIARVLDAGATPEGRPYFVMEYVRGEPLTTYCTKHKVSIRERLELFAQVCDGVQHAHQKGIIHRDLKPSNVLVAVQDDRPIAKVIDFGVAKATAQTLTERPLHTEFGAIIGTPEYMSPEQAEMTGLDVDTRTDVYALGVILYELLTGTLPFESKVLREGTLDEIRRTIREVDPPRPSARARAAPPSDQYEPASASRLAYDLTGDLDWITTKALEKDRTRRYQTANALALDVRRHLSGEPVLAAPPSTSYRLGKFAKRNRAAVTAAAVLVLLLVGFATAMMVQARRIALERDRANREATTARAISTFLQEDLLAQAGADRQAASGGKPDPNLTVRSALDRAAARLPGKFSTEPQVEASLRQTIGVAYQQLGLYSEALGHFEAASDLRRRTLGETHPDTLTTMATLGDLHRLLGNYEPAEQVLQRVVEAGNRVLGEEHRVTQEATSNLAIVNRYLGKYQEAERLYLRNLEITRRVSGERHLDTIMVMNNLATLYQLEGKYSSSEELFARAIPLAVSALGKEHPVTMTLINNQGNLLASQGSFARAAQNYLTLVDYGRRVWGEKHPNMLTTMTSLAVIYTLQGQYSEAEPLFGHALTTGRSVQGEDHPNTLLTKHKLVELYRAQGKYAQADTLLSAVVASRRRVLGEEHPDTLSSLALTAELFLHQRKNAEAAVLLLKVLGSRRRVLGNKHPATLATEYSLGCALFEQRKYEEAEQILREAVTQYEESALENWIRYASQSMLGASLAGQGKYAEAEPLLLSGYQGMTRLEGRIPAVSRQAVAKGATSLVKLYESSGAAEKATEWRSRSLTLSGDRGARR